MRTTLLAVATAAFVLWSAPHALGQGDSTPPPKETDPAAPDPGAGPGKEDGGVPPPQGGGEPKIEGEGGTAPGAEPGKDGQAPPPQGGGEPKKEGKGGAAPGVELGKDGQVRPPQGGEQPKEEDEEGDFFTRTWNWGLKRIEESFKDWKRSRTITLDDDFETSMRRKQKLREVTQSVHLIKDDEIGEKGANFLDMSLGTSPGLEVWNLGWWASPSHLSIRGTYERHTLVVLDGRPINTLWDGAADVSWIPLVAARRVETVKGPCSHTWGSGAMGGVVQVLTRDPSENLNGTGGGMYMNYDSYEVRGWNSWKQGPFGYFLGGSIRHTRGDRPNSELSSDDTFLKVLYDFTPQLKVKASIWLHRDDHGVPGSDPPPGLAPGWGSEEVQSLFDNERKRHFSSTVTAEYVASVDTVVTASLYADNNWFRVHTRGPAQILPGTVSNYDAYHENPTVGVTLRTDFLNRVPGHRITMGFDFHESNYAFTSYESEVTATYDPDADSARAQSWRRSEGIAAFFANDTWKVFKGATVEAALRFDFHHRTWFQDSYHLGAALEIDPHTVLRASISRGFRFPSFSELYSRPVGVYHPWTSMTYMRVPGNSNLSPERILALEIGGSADREIKEVPLVDKITLFGQVAGFYHFLSDQIDSIPPFGITKTENLHQKVVWGFDLYVQAHPSKFLYMNFNYTWLWAYGYHYEATATTAPIPYEKVWRRSDAVPHSYWRFETIFNTGLGLKAIYFAQYTGARIYWWENIGATNINWERNSVNHTFRQGLYFAYDFFGVVSVFAGYQAYPAQSEPSAAVDPYPSSMGEEYTYPMPLDGFNVGVSAGSKF